MKLSLLQAKILDLLTIQQEIRFSKLAKTLKISQPLLAHHIHTLEKNNIIQRFKVVINQNNQEQTYHTLLKVRGTQEQFVRDMQTAKPLFKWVFQTFGEYDFIIAKKLASPTAYQTMLHEIYQSTDTIESHHTLIETSGTIYNTQFSKSIKRSMIKYYDVSFPAAPKGIIKLSIIEELKKDALISQLQLAEKLQISYPTLRTHLQDLKKQHILIGERIKINFDQLGLAQYYLFLQCNPSKVSTLSSFAEVTPQIIRLSNCIGEYNAVLELITHNEQETETVITNIKKILTTNLHSLKLLHKTKDIKM